MCETYGAMEENDEFCEILYKEAMDEYAKGINHIIPHAVWYSDHAGIPPELSYRNRYAKLLPDFTLFISRLTALLEGGRHVADIAVLYPIDDLQSVFHFTQNNHDCTPEYSNYMDIGEQLSLDIRKDFTYLHPQIIKQRCSIKREEKTLYLNNQVNFEEYKIIILPAMRLIDYEVLERIYEFYKIGGKVISIGKLPCSATRSDQTKMLLNMVNIMFGNNLHSDEITWNYNEEGGQGCFIPQNQIDQLGHCLNRMEVIFDVSIGKTEKLSDGTLTYIHKIADMHNIFYFANSSNNIIDVPVTLRGKHKLWSYNPHNGVILEQEIRCNSLYPHMTEFRLELEPISSLFLVSD